MDILRRFWCKYVGHKLKVIAKSETNKNVIVKCSRKGCDYLAEVVR